MKTPHNFISYIVFLMISVISACDTESVNAVLKEKNRQIDNQATPVRLSLNQPYKLSEPLEISVLQIREGKYSINLLSKESTS